jgi:23S rRNA (adenine2503-C2)-methyltransferase
MISIHDLPEIEACRRRRRIDRFRLRQLRNAFYKKQRSETAALAELTADERAQFAKEVEFHALTLASRHNSQVDGASKLIFRTAQQLLIETVILRMTTGRTALCVSTQVGCAANCDFCATGKMGIARNLSPAEILDQLVQANQLLAAEGRAVRNLVFMGMGEPFHNEEALYRALDVLIEGSCFNLNPKRILISTVGIPDAMVRCAQRYPEVRLALSLHSAREEVRSRIMPISQRFRLAELREALRQVTTIQQHLVMIEYLLLKDVNDAVRDAQALIDYLQDIPVHINLIPYNPIVEAPHLSASEPERRVEFSEMLKAAGFPVTTRYSLGADIAAACGQLVRQEHRRHFSKAAGLVGIASDVATPFPGP